jgi:hypothetical protein
MSVTVVYNAGQGHGPQLTEHTLSFTVEMHNAQLNPHTTRGTRVGRIGSKTPISMFENIELLLLSAKAADQTWTHAFALSTLSFQVVGVWKHDLGTTRCVAITERHAAKRILPLLYPSPLNKVVTGTIMDARTVNEGTDWARREFQDESTAVAVLVHLGQIYASWERTAAGDPVLATTGARSILV